MKHTVSKLFALLLALLITLSACRSAPPAEPSSSGPASEPAAVSSSESVSEPEPSPEPPESSETELLYPVGGIGTSNFIDPDRSTYDGTMILEVPRMDFEGMVLEGTTADVLEKGVGLFPEGQLPGPENRNVCIAGHRDIYGKEFWDIDKITDGDLFYLTYHDKRYTYEYVETLLTEPDDWTAVRVKEYSAITLQSCDPIMVASHRIFKIGKLISIEDIPKEEKTVSDTTAS